MKLQFKPGYPEKKSLNTAAFLYETEDRGAPNQPGLNIFKGIIDPLLKQRNFEGARLTSLPVKLDDGWLLMVGLGPANKFGPAEMLEAAAQAAKAALNLSLTELEFILPSSSGGLTDEDIVESAVVGARSALYKQTECKSAPGPKPTLTTLRFRAEGLKNGPALVKKAALISDAVLLARRLGDLPANKLHPESFAQEATKLAKALKMKVQVLDEKALAREKLNLILAVGGGGARGPRLVTITYQGAGARRPPVALVGKGITFDSGGMSLKPAGSLEGMKTDMAGAAAVLAIIAAAAEMKLPLNLLAVMPLAENMPDGAGLRVGDVITGRSGQTVEITNTDAEGRLVLADALNWAGDFKPAAIIDVATLTGACAVALGDHCAGLFTDNERLSGGLLAAAGAVGEHIWRLPLLNDYEELLKSETADMVNAPGVPRGGAINAALFLRKFVAADRPWAHLDIAGPSRSGKARPGTSVGATGFAVRTLLRYLADLAAGEARPKPKKARAVSPRPGVAGQNPTAPGAEKKTRRPAD